MTPQLTTSGRTLLFLPNGDLAVLDQEQQTVHGAWRGRAADGEAKENTFRYTLDGAEQPPLRARYTFNDLNQLQVVLEAFDGQSAPALLVGGIEVDDRHDIVYRLVDDNGADTGTSVVLYGELNIERNTNALRIVLEGGGETTVTGSSGLLSLEAAQNRIAAFAADDLLRFRASTMNVLDSGGVLEVPAKLEFAGSWDIQQGQLVFLSKVVGDLSRPDVSIGFAGKLGAVSAGFVYFADAEGTSAAFTIRGQHVWGAGDTQSDFNWQVSLGFSDKKFSASVDLDLNRVLQNGRRVSLAGAMNLKQADGGVLNLDLSLEAEYEWQDNSLVFKAIVNNEAGNFNYDLRLEGRLQLSGGQLTFSVRYTNTPGAEGVTIGLTFTGDRENAIQAIAFHLRVSPDQIDFGIEARFTLRQSFVAGVGRVMEEEAAA